VLNKLRQLQKEHLIDLEDACVVVRDAKGKIRRKQAVDLVRMGALSGAAWGGLFGALVGVLLLNPLVGLATGMAAAPARARCRARSQTMESMTISCVRQARTSRRVRPRFSSWCVA
jgi:uncharacterized membrane protein